LRRLEKIMPRTGWRIWDWGQRGAVLALYLLGAVSGAAGVMVCYMPAGAALLLGAFIIAAMLFAVAMLEKAPYERQAAKPGAL